MHHSYGLPTPHAPPTPLQAPFVNIHLDDGSYGPKGRALSSTVKLYTLSKGIRKRDKCSPSSASQQNRRLNTGKSLIL